MHEDDHPTRDLLVDLVEQSIGWLVFHGLLEGLKALDDHRRGAEDGEVGHRSDDVARLRTIGFHPRHAGLPLLRQRGT